MSKTRSILLVLLLTLSTFTAASVIAITGPDDGPVPVAEAPPTSTDRVVLVELVTAGWCPNCPNADGALSEMEVAYGRDQLVILAYHRNDQLSNEGGDARQALYGNPYQPDAFIDGLAEVAGNRGSVSANRAAYEAEVDARLEVPSPLSLTVEGWTDTDTGMGVAIVNFTALADPGLDDLRLHVVLFEDDFGPWNGGNGVTTHDWVTRQLLTGKDGQAISMEVGAEESLSFTYDASDLVQDLDQVGVVAFVQSAGTTHEVLQAAYSKEFRTTPVASLPEFANPKVTPEKGNTSATFRYEIGYRDDDGDPPVTAQVVVDGIPYDLQTDHPNGPFTEWTGYYIETTLTVGVNHTYRFVFTDGETEFLLPDPSQGPDHFVGPTVEPPVSAPTLSLPTVEPAEGDPLALWTFSVVYTDGEGDAPTTSQLVIDGVTHDMTGQGTSYRTGVTYTYSLRMSGGDHEYHIIFGDGVHGARLPSSGSKNVTVRYEVQRIRVETPDARDGQVMAGEELTLAFDDTDVPQGLVTSYLWESDLDGVLGREASATFSLSKGDHDITLTIGTSDGTKYITKVNMTATRRYAEPMVGTVMVTPEAPREGDVLDIEVIVLNGGNEATAPFEVALMDADGNVLANATVEDAIEPGAMATTVLQWTAVAGTHALTVRAGGDVYPLQLTVEENMAPVVNASIEGGGHSFKKGEGVAFTVQAADPENDEVTYHWDFGDGTTSNETSPSHKYSRTGKYTVTVTVTDDRGADTTDTLDLKVTGEEVPGPSAVAVLLVVFGVAAVVALTRRR